MERSAVGTLKNKVLGQICTLVPRADAKFYLAKLQNFYTTDLVNTATIQ